MKSTPELDKVLLEDSIDGVFTTRERAIIKSMNASEKAGPNTSRNAPLTTLSQQPPISVTCMQPVANNHSLPHLQKNIMRGWHITAWFGTSRKKRRLMRGLPRG